MKCIVGLLTPEKGEVLYDGRNFLAMGKKEKKHLRREMGMIFQSAALFDSMSVLDNVMFPLNMFGTDTLREQTKRAMFCLDRVNLTEAKDKFPGEISGGMQKRVAIARAIALNPQYLFCDEPNRTRPENLFGNRRPDSRYYPGVQYDHHHQYSRHELGNGYWRKDYLYLSGNQRVGRYERRHLHFDQRTAEQFHFRFRPAA